MEDETESGSQRDILNFEIPLDDLMIKDFPYENSPRKIQTTSSFRLKNSNSEPALAQFSCKCSICSLQSKGKIIQNYNQNQEKDDIASYEGKEKSFN